MTAAGEPLVRSVYFGYEPGLLCVRIDLRDEPERTMNGTPDYDEILAHELSGIRLRFPTQELQLNVLPGGTGRVLLDGPWPQGASARVEAAWNEIVEVRLPFEVLNVQPGDDLNFFVEASAPNRATERYPRNCAISLNVPPADVHEHEWIA